MRHDGSITVEAAFCLPMFLFALLAICRLFLCIETEYRVREGLYEAAREMSCTALLAEKLTDAVETTVKAAVAEELSDGQEEEEQKDSEDEQDPEDAERIKEKEDLLHEEEAAVTEIAGWIAKRAVQTAFIGDGVTDSLTERGFTLSLFRGGSTPNGLRMENISFAGSEISDSDVMDILFSCDLVIPTGIFGSLRYPLREELKYRVFSGHDVKSLLAVQGEEENGSGTEVYVTESGSVYHTSLSCPSLRISLRAVYYRMVNTERSDSGARYYPCEKCAKGSAPETVYVTSDGNRYHYKVDCSALKRGISTVDISEVGERTKCKRCP